jgi:hypothetical protein
MIYDNKVIFTLQGLMKHRLNTNYVVVDMGAISFIIKFNGDHNVRISFTPYVFYFTINSFTIHRIFDIMT